MARHCSYATEKVEEWRSIDLADLRRWKMLDPMRVGRPGQIPAITWTTPNSFDKLGVIARADGVLFVRRDDRGQLGKLSVPYVFCATKFGGRRAWCQCPGCGQGCRVLYGVNSLRCRQFPGGCATSRNTRPRPFVSLIGHTRSAHGWGSRKHLMIPCHPSPHTCVVQLTVAGTIGVAVGGGSLGCGIGTCERHLPQEAIV
jgi:hypothetical protein